MKLLLEEKINRETATIGIIGLGYVGLPTALHYINRGFNVIGYDYSGAKVESLNKRKSYISDVSDNDLAKALNKGLTVTSDAMLIKDMDIVFICVPTPITELKSPDMTYIASAAKKVVEYVKKGSLVVLESTSYPGTTEEFLGEAFEAKGYTIGADIFVSYSPERIDPGNKFYNADNTNKVVGGMTKNCLELASAIIGVKAYEVSHVKTAELSKLYENTFRWVNIALVNEMAQISTELDIDIWEVVEAADSKPYGFMKFKPNIGVGGHCIPVDPYYLSYTMARRGKSTKMIRTSGEVNEQMKDYAYFRLLESIDKKGLVLSEFNVIILGASYKENIGDYRESPILKFIQKLKTRVKSIKLIDPLISDELKINNVIFTRGEKLDTSELKNYDLTIIGTAHDCFRWEDVFNSSNLIYDTKNIMNESGFVDKRIIKL